jgi:hypothetical protein
MALREARATRRAVIQASVARAPAAAGSTAVIAEGVDRRQDLHAETRDHPGDRVEHRDRSLPPTSTRTNEEGL